MLNQATSDQFIVLSKYEAIIFCTLRKCPQEVKWTNTGYFSITLIVQSDLADLTKVDLITEKLLAGERR
jgi:hypothetical protein